MAQIALGILIGAGLTIIIWIVVEQRKTIQDLHTRVTSLEACNRKRMPYAAQDELLDAMAVLDRLTMDADVLNAIRENVRGHIANALQVGTVAARAATTGDAGSKPARDARDEGEL